MSAFDPKGTFGARAYRATQALRTLRCLPGQVLAGRPRRTRNTLCSTDHGGVTRRVGINQRLILHVGESVDCSLPRAGVPVMDAASLREKAGLCLRISRRLSWNNPARLQLLEVAERFERQAKELELQNHPAERVA